MLNEEAGGLHASHEALVVHHSSTWVHDAAGKARLHAVAMTLPHIQYSRAVQPWCKPVSVVLTHPRCWPAVFTLPRLPLVA